MTENEKMGGEVPQDLPPDTSDSKAELIALVELSKNELIEIAEAMEIRVRSRDTKVAIATLIVEARAEAPVGLADDSNTDDTDQATDDADESDDSDEAPVGLADADEQDTDPDQAEGQTEDFGDEQDSDEEASEPGAIKAALGRINLRSRRTWVIIIGVLAVLALIAASVVISLDRSNDRNVDAADPVVTVDDVFAGLCETTGDVDLTIMPIAGFSLDGLNANSDADAATTQAGVVDDYFVDTALGCSPQGIEFLRTGVDQSRIDADRAGLDTRDSAGRIAYYSDHSEEALVVAQYLNKVMSESAAEMVVLTEADVQDGLFVLTFTDGSYEDLVWVKIPVETALSGVDSIEVMSATIGLVEGSDGLTRSFMYSEGLRTFVSVETPFGNTVEFVPAPVEDADVEPDPVTPAGEGSEVNDDPEPAVDEPKVDAPKVDTPKADEPKVDTPKADTPTVDEPKVDTPKVDTPVDTADTPADVKPETPADNADQTTDVTPDTPVDNADQTTDVTPDTPVDDTPAAPVGPVETGDGGTIPSTSPGDGGCNGSCGGPNEDGSSGGTIPGDGGGGCVGVCVGQGGGNGPGDGDNGGGPGGCNVDCPGDGGDEPTEPADDPTPEDEPEPEEEPEDDPEDEDECLAPNTLDAFGNCKAPPPGGSVDL